MMRHYLIVVRTVVFKIRQEYIDKAVFEFLNEITVIIHEISFLRIREFTLGVRILKRIQ